MDAAAERERRLVERLKEMESEHSKTAALLTEAQAQAVQLQGELVVSKRSREDLAVEWASERCGLETTIKEHQSQQLRLETRIEELQLDLSAAEQDKVGLERVLANQQEEREKLDKELADQRMVVKRLETDLVEQAAGNRSKLVRYEEEHKEAMEDLRSAHAEDMEALRSVIEELEGWLSEADQARALLEKERAEERSRLVAQIQDLDVRLEGLGKELAEARSQREEEERAHMVTQADLSRARQEREELKEQVRRTDEGRSRAEQRVVAALQQQEGLAMRLERRDVELEEATVRNSVAAEQLKAMTSERDLLQTTVDALRESLRVSQAELDSALSALDLRTRCLEASETEFAELRMELESRRSDWDEARGVLEGEKEQLKAQLTEKIRDHDELLQRVTVLSEELQTVTVSFKELKSKNLKTESRMLAAEAQLDEGAKEVLSLKERLAAAEEEAMSAGARVVASVAQGSELQGRLSKAVNHISAMGMQLMKLQTQVQEADSERVELHEKLSLSADRVREVEHQLRDYRSALERAEKRGKELEEELSVERSERLVLEHELSTVKKDLQELTSQHEDAMKMEVLLRGELTGKTEYLREVERELVLVGGQKDAIIATARDTERSMTNDINRLISENSALKSTLSARSEKLLSARASLDRAREILRRSDAALSQANVTPKSPPPSPGTGNALEADDVRGGNRAVEELEKAMLEFPDNISILVQRLEGSLSSAGQAWAEVKSLQHMCDDLRTQVSESRRQRTVAEQRTTAIQEELEGSQSRVAELTKLFQNTRSALQATETALAESQTRERKVEADVMSLTAELSEIRAILEHFRSISVEHQTHATRLQESHAAKVEEIAVLKSANERLIREVDMLKGQVETARVTKNEQSNQMMKLEGEVLLLEARCAEYSHKVSELRHEAEANKTRTLELQIACEKAELNLQNQKKLFQDLAARNAVLEVKLQTVEDEKATGALGEKWLVYDTMPVL